MRYFILFILIFVFACSKKSKEETPPPPPLSNYEVLEYLGLSVGKQHKYYAIDTIKATILPFIPETTDIYQDTILTVISDTFGNLNVIYYDSVYSSGQKTYDTLYVYNPFVIDSIILYESSDNTNKILKSPLYLNKIRTLIEGKNIILSSNKTVKGANKILKAPLYPNDSWIPIESQSIVLNDTSDGGQFFDCSLWIYYDTLKIDSSIKKVIEVGNDNTFKLFSKFIYRVLYRYQLKPHPSCDTTIQKSSIYLMSIDTTYLKPNLGIQRIIGFDSLATSLLFFYVYQKTYRKRFRVGP